MEMAKQRVIVDDAVIESGEIQEIIDPLWWSVSIYDGEEQYQRDLEGFTAPQRYLFALQWYLAEVNNGGHDQFYSNSTGIVWEDAMNGAREMGMEPYYLYRQKNMAGNFENVGYSLPGKACIYNILIMEEMQTIAACGAGTTTKVVFPSENRRERCENVKEVEQYISRIDEMIGRKEKILA